MIRKFATLMSMGLALGGWLASPALAAGTTAAGTGNGSEWSVVVEDEIDDVTLTGFGNAERIRSTYAITGAKDTDPFREGANMAVTTVKASANASYLINGAGSITFADVQLVLSLSNGYTITGLCASLEASGWSATSSTFSYNISATFMATVQVSTDQTMYLTGNIGGAVYGTVSPIGGGRYHIQDWSSNFNITNLAFTASPTTC